MNEPLNRQIQRVNYELQLLSEMLDKAELPVTKQSLPVTKQEKPSTEELNDKKVTVKKKPVKKSHKVSYDNDPNSPTYDPEPPFKPDPLPDRTPTIKPASLLIAKGETKQCNGCNKAVIQANRDIYAVDNNPDKGLTTKALDIIDDRYQWPEEIEVDKIHGGICITCPICGERKLWLVNVTSKGNQVSKNMNEYGTGSV